MATPEKKAQTNGDEHQAKPANPFGSMPKVVAQLTDRFGNTFSFGNAGDLWLPPFPIGADNDYRTHAQKVKNMELRPDDVLICSFPKTGIHWHSEIVNMLMTKKAEVAPPHKFVEGFLDLKTTETVDQLKSPRLLYIHFPFRHLPKQLFEKKIKIIYLDRNPKDILVSYYNHMHGHVAPLGYPGTFEHFFYLLFEVGYIYGDMFDYLLEWQRGLEDHPELDVYTSVFEDMKQDPVNGVKKLNEYLGTGCSDELCEQIARACEFKTLKAAKDAVRPEAVKAMFKSKTDGLFRKGEVGDWKNWFTVTMNEYFDKEYNKRMSGYKRQYKYTLP